MAQLYVWSSHTASIGNEKQFELFINDKNFKTGTTENNFKTPVGLEQFLELESCRNS